MKEIQLSKQGKNIGKYVALVDDEDYKRVNQFRWFVLNGRNTYYAARNITKCNGIKTIQLMHVFVLSHNTKYLIDNIDHEDHNGLNNQKQNIRNCSISQNAMNRIPENGCYSKFKGVVFDKISNKIKSSIWINGKRIHIGYFTNETDAAKAYDIKAKELFGEFAYLNFV